MDELKWTLLVEVFGRAEAEMLASYLEANSIPSELIQESYEHTVYPYAISSRVQVFVPKEVFTQAKHLYDESGWRFEVPDDETDEDEE